MSTRTVDDGTEDEFSATVKGTHYTPSATRGRMHMREGGADWSSPALGIKGACYMPMGSADLVVSIRYIGKSDTGHLVTFRAQDLINAAAVAFLGASCPRCHGPAIVVDKAPKGESGDVVMCPECDK